MSDENDANATEPVMLTTAIVSRFSEPVWVKADKINAGAEVQVFPLTRAKLLGWAMKHKICAECGGRGLYRDFQGALHSCPKCKGATSKTWSDPQIRLFMIREILNDARNLKGRDVNTGEIVDLVYSEELRDAIAETLAFEVIYDLATSIVSSSAERTEKN